MKEFGHSIQFEDVSFKYGDEWILKDLSFEVKKGEKVAIVGPTGQVSRPSSSFCRAFMIRKRGIIRIDGEPLTAYTQASIREQIAFVPQRPFLFIDTIRNNIVFGRPFDEKNLN